MSIADGRIAAWTSAWQCLESASTVRQQMHKLPQNPDNLDAQRIYRQEYESLMAEARVFVALTAVDLDVGIGGGQWLQQRYDAEQRVQNEQWADLFDRKPKDDEGESDGAN